MRLLIFNWKDHHHPRAGGAEDFTLHVAEGLANLGHDVTWFSSMYEGAPRTSDEGGVHYVRAGSMYSVHRYVRDYLTGLGAASRPDVVVDEVNTRPFFPERYTKVPVCNLIHQLAREVWFREVPLPVAILGRYFLEDHWLRQISSLPTITVSHSTAVDLQSLGFQNIRIVYSGVGRFPTWAEEAKVEPPEVVFLGRLTRSKRPEDALRAFRLLRETVPCSMTVIGDGPLLPRLKARYPDVTFAGHIGESEKTAILQRSRLLLLPGTREGWARVALEAQSCGVVPIAYNIPGLRDAVDQGRVGVLLSSNDPGTMAEAAKGLLLNANARQRLAATGSAWARSFSYERTIRSFEANLQDRNFLSGRAHDPD
jgi:glycosyltransferase involved in cell wall biosynthesis